MQIKKEAIPNNNEFNIPISKTWLTPKETDATQTMRINNINILDPLLFISTYRDCWETLVISVYGGLKIVLNPII